MDSFSIEILEDGTLKLESGVISGSNHVNAEGFVRAIAETMGGAIERKRKFGSHLRHHHDHSHTHEH